MNFTYKIIILLSLQIVANLVFPTSSQCQKVRVLFNDPVVLCKQYYEHDTIIKIGLTKKAIAKIKLTKCKFNQKDTNFTFHKPVLFVNSDLKTIVDFDNAVFQDTADFSGSNFEYNLECENGSFCLPVDFDSVCFVKDANFTGAVFSNNADFGDAKFSREVNFDNAKFLKNASFLHLQLTKTSKISFDNTTLPDTIDFSNNAKIAGEIDLETANFVDTSRYRCSR